MYKYRLIEEEQQVKGQPVYVKSPLETYEYLKNNVYTDGTTGVFESFYAVYVNNSMEVKGYQMISRGGITCTSVDPRIIFAGALMLLATGVLLTHNHPSGSLTPSRYDDELTEKILQGGKILDIQLVDHIIITTKSYFSYKENGKF